MTRPLSGPVGATRNIDLLLSTRSSRLLLLLNPGFGTCYPLPHRDSQGRQTAASMRLGGNQKAKPSRGEGRERTGGRAATEPQTRCWRGPKEADHGATEPRLCSPWLGGPHTPSSVKQFKNWKNWPPHLGPFISRPGAIHYQTPAARPLFFE